MRNRSFEREIVSRAYNCFWRLYKEIMRLIYKHKRKVKFRKGYLVCSNTISSRELFNELEKAMIRVGKVAAEASFNHSELAKVMREYDERCKREREAFANALRGMNLDASNGLR